MCGSEVSLNQVSYQNLVLCLFPTMKYPLQNKSSLTLVCPFQKAGSVGYTCTRDRVLRNAFFLTLAKPPLHLKGWTTTYWSNICFQLQNLNTETPLTLRSTNEVSFSLSIFLFVLITLLKKRDLKNLFFSYFFRYFKERQHKHRNASKN